MNDSSTPDSLGAETVIADVTDEFMERLRRGERPDVEDYARRHPQIAAVLRHVLPALEVIGSRAPGWPAGSAPTSTSELQPEGALGDFRLVREIGRGGMGVVYQAVQISLGREVALKVLPFAAALDSKQLQRFKNEAQAAAHLHHTNIVPVYEIGCERGVHYYAMQFIEGWTVAAVIAELRQHSGLDSETEDQPRRAPGALTRDLASGRWAPSNQYNGISPVSVTLGGSEEKPARIGDETASRARGSTPSPIPTNRSTSQPAFFRTVASLGAQVARGLEHAHSLGIVHRDIKPANLIIDVRGNIWITDFGLARLQGGAELTVTGDLVGTVRYMSPEQALADRTGVDHRTDIYSLGMTLYELMTLQPAFSSRDRTALLRQIAFEEPQRPRALTKSVPADLETIVLKSIEKNSADRYLTAGELADDLHRFLDDRPIRARRPTILERARKLARRHKPAVWSAVAALAISLLMLTMGLAVTNLLITREKNQALADRKKAERAEVAAKHRLFEARLAQARASRFSRQAGQRFDAWQALTEAASIARELSLGQGFMSELRDEAIASLALVDARPETDWEGFATTGADRVIFDAGLTYYARVVQGEIRVCRVGEDQPLATFPRPARAAHPIKFSPDGALLAVGMESRPDDRRVDLKLWDWQRSVIRFHTPSASGFVPISFSGDGRSWALGQVDGTVSFHEASTGKELKRLSLGFVPSVLALQPDGAKLAVAGDNRDVEVRDSTTGSVLQKLPQPTGLGQMAWQPDGVLLAVPCPDHHVYLWNTATGQQHAVLQGHQANAIGAMFSPAGDLLLSWGWDGTARLWDPWTGNHLLSFPGASAHFSRDGGRLATRSGDKLSTWVVARGQEYRRLAGCQPASSKAISPDGHWLAVAGDDGVQLWNLPRCETMTLLRVGQTLAAVFHPNGRELITQASSGLYRWPLEVKDGSIRVGPARRIPVQGRLQPRSLDREGRILAVSVAGPPSGVRVFDLEKSRGKPAGLLHHGSANVVAMSPDGRWVASAPWNGLGVKVWEIPSARLASVLIPDAMIADVAFSPDARWLVTATATEYRFWLVDSWALGWIVKRQQGIDNPGSVAFTPDGSVLAIGLSPSIVQLHEVATGRAIAKLQSPDSDQVDVVGFSADGSQLVVASRDKRESLRIWDLRLIRSQLRDVRLDWDLPQYPPAPTWSSAGPWNVDVAIGDLVVEEYLRRGQWGEAIAHLDRLIAEAPNDCQSYEERARAFVRLQEWDRATKDYAKIAELRPDWPECANERAWLLATDPDPRRRDARHSLALAQQAVDLAPANGMYWNTLGVARYRAGNWRDAVAALEKSISLQGQNSWDWFFMAMAHWRLGERSEAHRIYNTAVRWMQKFNPMNEELTRFRAEASELIGIGDRNRSEKEKVPRTIPPYF
jgi:serine/threonine protein kinase/WD40 repeat protein/Tfp pilus assembly protein PilF